MLVIRLQRTGRKGHAMFRVVVQDSRRTPSSGKVVAWLGSYDPHTKAVNLDKEKVGFYLKNGAQPSGRTAVILKNEGVKLPDWVQIASEKKRDVRNADKRKSTRPPEPVEEQAPKEEAAEPAAEAAEEAAAETEQETAEAKPEESVKAEEKTDEETAS
jgi:small subunit ribosomal protein S16